VAEDKKYAKMKDKKNKEVAKHPFMGSREESFGGSPGEVAIGGGNMHMFGHRHQNAGVWPANPVSADSKTGYPQGWEGKNTSPTGSKN
jgi:hypothetical protein